MIDWCIQCADAGCILTNHKDTKHRLFAYVFVRIMKDALIEHKETTFFEELGNTHIWCLDNKFYKEYIMDEPIGFILNRLWFKKSYWSFMRHVISESVMDVDFWNDYKFKVTIEDDGEVYFFFGKK